MSRSEKRRLEEISKEYLQPDAGHLVEKKLQSHIVEALFPWVRGPDVLEMGLGDGEWTRRLIQSFGRSCVVDGAEPLLDHARRTFGSNLKTYSNLFEEFSPRERFDTIVASFILEHVADPPTVLKKASSWLKPKGQIVVIVPNADSLHRRLAVCMGLQKATSDLGPTDVAMGHRRVYTVARVEGDIEAAGLVVKRRLGLFVKPLPQSRMTDFPDNMLAGFVKLGEVVPIELSSTLAFDCRKGEGS